MAEYLALRRLFRKRPYESQAIVKEFREAVIHALRIWKFPEGIENWFNDFNEAFPGNYQNGYSFILYDRNYARMISTLLKTYDATSITYPLRMLIKRALVYLYFNFAERVRDVIAEMVNVYGTNPLLIYNNACDDLNIYLFSLSKPGQRVAFQSLSNLIPENILDAYPDTVKHPIDNWSIEHFIDYYITDGTKFMKYAPNYGLNSWHYSESNRRVEIYNTLKPLISDGARIPTFIPMHIILILLAERLPSHNSEIGRRLPDELIRKLHQFLI